MKPSEKEIVAALEKIVALDKTIEGKSLKNDKIGKALMQAVTIAGGLLEQFEREKEN